MIPLPGEYKAIAYAVIVLCVVGLLGGAGLGVWWLNHRAEVAEEKTREAVAKGEEFLRQLNLANSEVEAANLSAKLAQDEVDKWAEIARNAAKDRTKNREVVTHAHKLQTTITGPSASPSCTCPALAVPFAVWARFAGIFGVWLRDGSPDSASGASKARVPTPGAP